MTEPEYIHLRNTGNFFAYIVCNSPEPGLSVDIGQEHLGKFHKHSHEQLACRHIGKRDDNVILLDWLDLYRQFRRGIVPIMRGYRTTMVLRMLCDPIRDNNLHDDGPVCADRCAIV